MTDEDDVEWFRRISEESLKKVWDNPVDKAVWGDYSKIQRARGYCEKHGKRGVYYPEYDAHACLECDEWMIGTCSDSECQFCATRPVKPSEIK